MSRGPISPQDDVEGSNLPNPAQLSPQGQFAMSLTQPYLAEALGLTAVHLNRVVRQFSKDGIFELGRGQVKVFDLAALTEIAGFDPSYLHAQFVDRP